MTDGRHIPQEDLAAYAMRATSQAEAALIREHLTICTTCQTRLAELSGDLALVAMSVEQQPLPQGARQRFLQRISLHEATASIKSEGNLAIAPVELPRRPMGWSIWISWGAVAALLLLTIALGIRIRGLDQQLRQQSALIEEQNASNARAQAVLDLLTAPAAQHVDLISTKTRPAPAARAIYLPSQGSLILQASNLDPVPTGKTYELWIIPVQGAPIPAGTFNPSAAGSASLVLPELPKGVQAKAFGITIENGGGSSTPTLPIVLQGAPSSPS